MLTRLDAAWVCGALLIPAVLASCKKDTPPTPAAQPSAQPSASAAPAKAASPLALVAKVPSDSVGLFNVGPFVQVNYSKLMFRGTREGLRQDPSLAAGLRPYFSWLSMFPLGEYPDRAFAEVAARGPKGGYSDVGANPAGPGAPESPIFKLVKGTWVYSGLTNSKDMLISIGTWSKDRSLGAALIEPYDDWRIFTAGGKAGGVPSPSAPKPPKPTADNAADGSAAEAGEAPSEEATPKPPVTEGGCKTNLIPFANFGAFVPLPSGHIFALGSDCTKAVKYLAVERWEPDNKKSTIDVLPGNLDNPSTDFRIVAVSGTEVYVLRTKGKPYLVKFDGKEWKNDTLPSETAGLTSMVAGQDGTLWALSDGNLYQRKTGAAWEAVELPKIDGVTPKLNQIAISGKDNLWAVTDKPAMVLGPTAPKEVLELPESSAVERMLEPQGGREGLFLATAVCESFFVLLQTGVIQAQTYPNIEKALKGQSGLTGVEYVVAHMGAPGLAFGAKAPDKKTADRIVELMKAADPKSIAQVACHVPNVKKQVTFE